MRSVLAARTKTATQDTQAQSGQMPLHPSRRSVLEHHSRHIFPVLFECPRAAVEDGAESVGLPPLKEHLYCNIVADCLGNRRGPPLDL